ncbi:hypothetical protein AMS68_005880 [Peltaster fructicola]|uniref:Uncharacterized protein n=1 Tax=Peltaster fructicola TaxID=286661 RepID=A0A6H0Y024_9PEZI|nr:hypothetical protein AMS68_005880 [Peltaster fructicola]
MDRPAPATPTHRDSPLPSLRRGMVSRRAWPKAADDPRQSLRIPHREELAPDPDEDDIERYDDDGAFQPAGFRARFERTRSEEAGNQQPQQGSGLFGFLGSALRLASDFVQPGPVQNAGEQQEGQAPASPTQSVTQRAISPDGTTVTRHVHGNGYSFTMTTTRGLQPRDPSGVQPFNRQPNDINDMMAQILGNIGAMPHAHAGFAAGPGSMFGDDIHRAGAPPPFPEVSFSCSDFHSVESTVTLSIPRKDLIASFLNSWSNTRLAMHQDPRQRMPSGRCHKEQSQKKISVTVARQNARFAWSRLRWTRR